MKLKKLVLEFGITAASAAIISVPATVSARAAEPASDVIYAESSEAEAQAAEAETTEAAAGETEAETTENTGDEAAQEEIVGTVTDEAASEWENKLLVIVGEDTSLNIREAAGTDSAILGKLYRGGAAEIVEKGEEWTKIVSGDVEGYVKNEYCLFAEEAAAQAEEICGTEATVTTDGVRVRSEANTDSSIYGVLEEGDSLTVSETDEEAESGWIQVEYGGSVAYVSADYVEVELGVSEAVSIDEVYAQQAAEAAAAAAASAASAETVAASGTAVSASADDLTLLAALIQCEAGGESYEGQLAVGAVVMNRVRSGSFPNSVSGVIYQSGQFSPASSGKLSRVLGSGSISGSCYQAAQAAMNGGDNTGGALYFHAGSSGGTVIGHQVFY